MSKTVTFIKFVSLLGRNYNKIILKCLNILQNIDSSQNTILAYEIPPDHGNINTYHWLYALERCLNLHLSTSSSTYGFNWKIIFLHWYILISLTKPYRNKAQIWICSSFQPFSSGFSFSFLRCPRPQPPQTNLTSFALPKTRSVSTCHSPRPFRPWILPSSFYRQNLNQRRVPISGKVNMMAGWGNLESITGAAKTRHWGRNFWIWMKKEEDCDWNGTRLMNS